MADREGLGIHDLDKADAAFGAELLLLGVPRL
jgi:hypothetical protein